MNATTPHDPHDAGQVAADFLTAYLSGDHQRARSLMHDDFTFQAPLVEEGTKEVYFAGAQAKVSFIDGFRILRQWTDGDDVAVTYEIDISGPSGSASMLMHEWQTVRDGKLASTVMIFDTAARGAQILHDALMAGT
jgi:predicted SnoaL-like aldol condensation-catalyzing enzyme